jgi:hypothetical protein
MAFSSSRKREGLIVSLIDPGDGNCRTLRLLPPFPIRRYPIAHPVKFTKRVSKYFIDLT